MAKLSIKTFKEALKNSGGNQARIAYKLEVGRSAVSMFLKRHPDMRIELNEEADRLIEWAEDNVAMSVMVHKDIADSKWLLTNSKKGKARGWGAKQEIEHSGETQPHTFNLIVKSEEEIKSDKLDNQPKTE